MRCGEDPMSVSPVTQRLILQASPSGICREIPNGEPGVVSLQPYSLLAPSASLPMMGQVSAQLRRLGEDQVLAFDLDYVNGEMWADFRKLLGANFPSGE